MFSLDKQFGKLFWNQIPQRLSSKMNEAFDFMIVRSCNIWRWLKLEYYCWIFEICCSMLLIYLVSIDISTIDLDIFSIWIQSRHSIWILNQLSCTWTLSPFWGIRTRPTARSDWGRCLTKIASMPLGHTWCMLHSHCGTLIYCICILYVVVYLHIASYYYIIIKIILSDHIDIISFMCFSIGAFWSFCVKL